ncbi:DUF6010 family protein [Glycomyces paridis]|uniref:DUF6010 family protein n=1 Tax=Glycomyces paridis TaxID=2126555 RepID=UPI001864AB16|nr:DUF6010 family protein [Glycomyces paridis]
MTATAPQPARTAGPLRTAAHRWPALLGAVFAAFVAWDLGTGGDLAPVLTASGLIYLGAAAIRRPNAAWPLFAITFVIIGAAGFTPWENLATWVLIGLAAALAVYGLATGAVRPPEGLPLQSLGMAVFGAAAVAAVLVGGDLAAYLVAVGLLGHAAWDVHHHRTGRVVARSLAEFCVVLDTVVAVVIVIATLNG